MREGEVILTDYNPNTLLLHIRGYLDRIWEKLWLIKAPGRSGITKVIDLDIHPYCCFSSCIALPGLYFYVVLLKCTSCYGRYWFGRSLSRIWQLLNRHKLVDEGFRVSGPSRHMRYTPHMNRRRIHN